MTSLSGAPSRRTTAAMPSMTWGSAVGAPRQNDETDSNAAAARTDTRGRTIFFRVCEAARGSPATAFRFLELLNEGTYPLQVGNLRVVSTSVCLHAFPPG